MHATALQFAENSELARKRFLQEERRPLMFSDWRNAVFIHFETDAKLLQKQIPYELDVLDGKAYVSVVAFSFQRLRLTFGGVVTEQIFRPIANHEFFNVRTYVRHKNRVGIYFMAGRLNNRLSVALGPRSYGLPYRFGDLKYEHNLATEHFNGTARTANGRFNYRAQPLADELSECKRGTLDEFLLERYIAYTWRRGVGRYFQIWHPPWPMVPLELHIEESTLLQQTGRWFESARLVSGNFSPGVSDIWMSAPHRVRT